MRSDYWIAGDPGIELFVREVRTAQPEPDGVPVVLLHGARVPSVPSFDLDVSGGSLAADLAGAGHAVYLMDARGFGYSTRPIAMSRPASEHPPLVRSAEVVRDIAAVVAWVRERHDGARVALLGWATGSHWMGMYTSLFPDGVSHLILYNTLYGVAGPWPVAHGLEDPEHPGRFNRTAMGAYRLVTPDSLTAAWDASIPVSNLDDWRDPAIVRAYQEAALASDETSGQRSPAAFRAPSGPLEDSFYLAQGRQFWDASLIRAATLVIASERDFWSRPIDRERLLEHLIDAESARLVVLPDATHFVHLDRPERGRDRFIAAVSTFLRE
jgi:pimeloyl-ACP methyl ester carboxylesterase